MTINDIIQVSQLVYSLLYMHRSSTHLQSKALFHNLPQQEISFYNMPFGFTTDGQFKYS